MKTEFSISGPHRLPLPAIAPAMIEAVVQTAATETLYCRAGRGAQVLLLTAGGARAPCSGVLFQRLAEHFRVIAPEPDTRAGEEPPREPVATSAWLRDVIDGLGLKRPSLVADDAFGIAALSFALTDPERVDRLVLVTRDAADPLLSADAFGDNLRQSGHPLLLLRFDPAAGLAGAAPAMIAAMIHFLTGDADAPAQARIRLPVEVVEPAR